MRYLIRLFLLLSSTSAILTGCQPPVDVGQTEPSPTPQTVTATVPSNDPAVAFLQQYGWQPHGEPREIPFNPVPRPDGPPIERYLEASRAVGLDFSAYNEDTVTLHKYLVDEQNSHGSAIYAFVLRAEDQVVGAWLFVEQETPGLYAVNAPRDQLD